jgi:hypothetical protein
MGLLFGSSLIFAMDLQSAANFKNCSDGVIGQLSSQFPRPTRLYHHPLQSTGPRQSTFIKPRVNAMVSGDFRSWPAIS